MKNLLNIVPIAAAMALAAPIGLATPADAFWQAAGSQAGTLNEGPGKDAKQCIAIEGGDIVNRCNHFIDAGICTEGGTTAADSDNKCAGQLIWTSPLAPGEHMEHGGGPNAYVRYGACVGGDSHEDYRLEAIEGSYTYRCHTAESFDREVRGIAG